MFEGLCMHTIREKKNVSQDKNTAEVRLWLNA